MLLTRNFRLSRSGWLWLRRLVWLLLRPRIRLRLRLLVRLSDRRTFDYSERPLWQRLKTLHRPKSAIANIYEGANIKNHNFLNVKVNILVHLKTVAGIAILIVLDETRTWNSIFPLSVRYYLVEQRSIKCPIESERVLVKYMSRVWGWLNRRRLCIHLRSFLLPPFSHLQLALRRKVVRDAFFMSTCCSILTARLTIFGTISC